MRWTRRLRLPADVRRGLPLEPGERPLAAALCSDGGWAVATDRALLLPGQRVDWAEVTHADWDDQSRVLAFDVLAATGQPAVTHRLALEEEGFLPETVRERVTDSIVATRHAAIRGKGRVQVVARRSATADGLRWQVLVDRGLDADDPQVRALAERVLSELRGDLGG